VDILLDLIILGIIIICTLIGYYRGLLRSLFGLVSFGFAIFLAISIFPRVAEWLRETPLYTGLKAYIIRNIALEEVVQEHTYEIIKKPSPAGFAHKVSFAIRYPKYVRAFEHSKYRGIYCGVFCRACGKHNFCNPCVYSRMAYYADYSEHD
jgi:hypothetical protein